MPTTAQVEQYEHMPRSVIVHGVAITLCVIFFMTMGAILSFILYSYSGHQRDNTVPFVTLHNVKRRASFTELFISLFCTVNSCLYMWSTHLVV